MTQRERDILKASVSWTDKTLTVNEEKAFQAGAKWADKTMIDKAVKWLRENAKDYVVTCYDRGELDDEGLLYNFCKAMEE
jgi:hypothetical protein